MNFEYTINSGDCLWNIVKNNYNVNNTADIIKAVNFVAQANNIKDPNIIYSGQKLNLPESDDFVLTSKEAQAAAEELSRVDKFDEWTDSDENYEKFLNGEEIEDFEMFDVKLSQYSTDLKDFAQEYIDKYDEDADGKWNLSEFTKMAAGNQEIPAEYQQEFAALNSQLFKDLNIDADKDSVTAAEYASFLYAADMDWDGYSKDTTKGIAPYIDGKINWGNYQALGSLEPGSNSHRILQDQKKEFFDHYYA